jgi:hypothetical protein
MQQPFPPERSLAVPSFYLTGRQPIRPAAIVLAIVTAVGALSAVVYAMSYSAHTRFAAGGSDAARSAGAPGAPPAGDKDDEDDDPSRVDTIVLGDPSDAPVPAHRGDHVSPVHPTILVRLPRFGDQVGLIPDTPAGRLLYTWLAAFNQAGSPAPDPALTPALPPAALDSMAAAQRELRQQTGGYSLLSAKEVQPGILVFRLRDQTPEATEALGTLQVRPNSNPPAIATFSLRALPSPRQDSIRQPR